MSTVVDFKAAQIKKMRKDNPVWKPVFLQRVDSPQGGVYDWHMIPDYVHGGPAPMLIGVLPHKHEMLRLMEELHRRASESEVDPHGQENLDTVLSFVANIGMLNSLRGKPGWNDGLEAQWQALMHHALELSYARQYQDDPMPPAQPDRAEFGGSISSSTVVQFKSASNLAAHAERETAIGELGASWARLKIAAMELCRTVFSRRPR